MSCPKTGKKQYVSRGQAKRARNGMEMRANPGRMHPYVCPACHRWHLGH